jgi:5-methylcytosine-specific restriction protein A
MAYGRKAWRSVPTAAKPLCLEPGCGERAVIKGRCRAHQTGHYRRIERYRGTAKARGYDAAWRRVRLDVLRAEFLCRMCNEAGVTSVAVEVDHVIPLAHGGARLDRQNLQPLCRMHHAEKTAIENEARLRG